MVRSTVVNRTGKWSFSAAAGSCLSLTLNVLAQSSMPQSVAPKRCSEHVSLTFHPTALSLCSTYRSHDFLKAQTPLRTCCTTPPTDTTNGRAHNNSTTNLPHRNARAQHLDMSRCWDVANFCPLVVNLLYNKL